MFRFYVSTSLKGCLGALSASGSRSPQKRAARCEPEPNAQQIQGLRKLGESCGSPRIPAKRFDRPLESLNKLFASNPVVFKAAHWRHKGKSKKFTKHTNTNSPLLLETLALGILLEPVRTIRLKGIACKVFGRMNRMPLLLHYARIADWSLLKCIFRMCERERREKVITWWA